MLHGAARTRYGVDTRSVNRIAIPNHRGILTLAIETSCDDTCVAILSKGRDDGKSRPRPSNEPLAKLWFNEKVTADNSAYRGIHPLKALDSHRANLAKLVNKSLQSLPPLDDIDRGDDGTISLRAHGMKMKPDFISVTRGPGMRSNLSCGLDLARGLAIAFQVPMVAVNHMQAHALTPRLATALGEIECTKPRQSCSIDEGFEGEKAGLGPSFPFLSLLISGGHTMLVHSKALTEHAIIATTADVAIGAALDKIGRLVLPKDCLDGRQDTAFAKYLSEYAFADPGQFPEWPIPTRRVDEIVKPANKWGWQIQQPFGNTRDLMFSFSGIASRIESLWDKRQRLLGGSITADERLTFARTALGTAFEHLASRTIIALEKMGAEGTNVSTLVVSGGVAANAFLRYFLRETLSARGFGHVQLAFPPPHLCTDNAAMIAWTGMEMFEAGFQSDLGCGPLRKWAMDSECEDGGIAGMRGWAKVPNIAVMGA